ncbi:MAG TPA: hypothetical protein EYQ25_00605 [Planctomycetes bacterium]|nr:hypothetical protein [Planctomycetota bacterium]HIL37809.1 hypothetical protein [Planctomycetota bacterium]
MSEARYQDIQIESTLPKPWEHEDSFNDVLYEWMERAPWLAISAVAHFAAIMLLAAIPWNLFFPPDEVIIDASTAQAPEEAVEDPPEEEEEEIEEVETEEEPIIQDYEVSDHNEVDVDQDFELTDGDPDMMSNSPFDQKNFNNVIGVGGGAGGKYGGRFGGNRNLRAGGGGTAQALADGLEWLKNHQAPDGSWDVDEYWINNVSGGTDCSEGAGSHIQDTGITGLALLAFLGDGHTMRDGLYKDVVTKGIKWMRKEQDPETGLLGQDIGEAFLYDHAIASLAMAEAYVLSNKTPILSSTVRNATKYIVNSRNPYGAWRYQVPPIGENDTSVTGWMVFALKSAEEGGFKISKETYAGALTWFDEVTDPGTGRMGYDSIGSLSSRVDGINDDFPADKGEAMTAVGLLCRFFMGQDPKENPIMEKHADLLLKRLPEWDPEGKGTDMYYWYYGSYAMFQMGGKHWKSWKKAMEKAVLNSQRKDGDYKGSWDPVGPWGYSGGRVYSTSLLVLCLEVYFRYARVLGAR